MFNALKYIKNLEAVGFPRDQAEAQVQLVFDAIEEEVATKSDIAEVKSDIAVLRTDIAVLRSDLSTAEAKLRGEISEFKTEIIFKLGALAVTCTTAATAILGFLIKF